MPRPALALILAATTLAGCSLSISAPSSSRKVGEPPQCDTGKGLVALDSLMAIGLGIGGLAALSEDQGTGAIAIVGAALFTAAALHGSSNADKCRTAYELYAKETRTDTDGDDIARRSRRRRRQEPQQVEQPPPVATPAPAKAVTKPDPDPGVTDPQPAKPPKQRPSRTDDWSQFWREVGQ